MQENELDLLKLGIDVSNLSSLKSNKVRDFLDDCPYNCNRGKIFLPGIGSQTDCPHCSEIYKAIASGERKDDKNRDIYEILCIPRRYKNIEFSIDTMFSDDIKESITSDSLNSIIENLKSIYNTAIRGEFITSSYLFYLGEKMDILPYIFNLLKQGYASGLKVVPYVNTLELIQLYKADEEPLEYKYRQGIELQKELNVTFMDYCRADLVIISIPTVAGKSSINMVQTILNSRRKRGLETIIFSETDGSSRELGYVLNNYEYLIKSFIEGKKTSKSAQQEQNKSYQQEQNKTYKQQSFVNQQTTNKNLGVDEDDDFYVQTRSKL